MALWNFTIDDASPYLSYSPYGDGAGFSGAWQTWYTVSGLSSAPDQASRGDSYHITSSKNANVTLQFIGTGVALYGFTNSSFDVIIDGGPRTSIKAPITLDSLLYSNYSLTNELHSVTLSAQPSQITNSTQTLAFDFAIASTTLANGYFVPPLVRPLFLIMSWKISENPPSPLFHDSSNTASFLYSGAWAAGMQDGVPNATVSAPFQKTAEVGASVSFSFTGANAVAVKGLASSENGMYSVSLDGSAATYNGSSLWIIPDALLYFRAGLDPNSTHQLNITNLSARLCLNSIITFKHESRDATPNSTQTSAKTPHSSNKVGVILGPAIGGLLFVILGIFFWYRRRCSQQNRFKIGIHNVSRKLTFSKPKPNPKPSTPLPPHPSTVVSPMLATLDQDSRSTYDACSAYNGSDAHSSTNLLNAASGFGRRSIRSISSEADSSEQMNSFAGWERTQRSQVPTVVSQASSAYGYGHHSSSSTDSTSQFSNTTQRTALPSGSVPIASSSTSQIGSFRRGHTPAPDYIPMSPRKPLPTIPVPSYDAALRAPELTPDDAKDMLSLQFSVDHGLDPPLTAPSRYER
ncbi:hypothetical protein FPV67DRAFT_92828 [Lyophyllum atratum]|nr:hypothetical protein FPV67DRAFT_92828 [Lyophyllum atratum]